MKKLQIILSTSLVVTITFSLLIISSCKKGDIKYNDSTLIRPCDNVICLNGATCNDGLCVCPLGFEGTKCEGRWSTKFIGNYNASDNCFLDSNNAFYDVTITGNTDYAYKITFLNLGTFCPTSSLSADINPEKSTFEIPMQNSCGDVYQSGYGNISGNYINIYLKSRDTIQHTSNQCSIVLSKK